MTVEALEMGLRAIARRDCPCICCRNNAEVAKAVLAAHERRKIEELVLNPADVRLTDAAEGRELIPETDLPVFHHPV